MDVKEENLDELLEKAELEAAGDEVVSSGRNLSKRKIHILLNFQGSMTG